MTVEIITLILRLAIVVMGGFVVPAFRKWIQTKTENENMNRLKAAAETAVYAAEQMHKATGDVEEYRELRRKFAHDAISRTAHKIGIVLTEAEINALMEAAVQELNLVKHGGLVLPEVECEA